MLQKEVPVHCGHCGAPVTLVEKKHSDGWRIDTARCPSCRYLIYNKLGGAMKWN